MNFHVLTLFPEMILSCMHTSIIGRAMEKGLLSIDAVNIRDFAFNKHQKVDDYPYGGGAGMLMQAEPVYLAWESIRERAGNHRLVYLTPQGRTFDQEMARDFAKEEHLTFLCGHYEGIDERVLEEIVTDPVSIGDYVVTGGELPAMVMMDAISRMVPGVLSNAESGELESFSAGLLEYPQYSRPEVWHGKSVPAVLLSGHHANVDAWRREQSLIRTVMWRPDLLRSAPLTNKEWMFVKDLQKKLRAEKEQREREKQEEELAKEKEIEKTEVGKEVIEKEAIEKQEIENKEESHLTGTEEVEKEIVEKEKIEKEEQPREGGDAS